MAWPFREEGWICWENVASIGFRIKLTTQRWRFRLEQADVVDEAAPAFGPPRFAHIAAVQDEPMMGVVLVALWNDAVQLELDL